VICIKIVLNTYNYYINCDKMSNEYYIDIDDNIKIEYNPLQNTKQYHLTLGNLTTSGWYWSSDNTYDLLGFFIRSIDSKFEDEFLKLLSKEADFTTFKNDLLKSAKKGNGLYEISGDNEVWYNGSKLDDIIDDEIEEIYNSYFIDSNITHDKFFEDVYDSLDIKYEDFEKEYKKRYIDEISEIINESKDFYDLKNKLNEYETNINDYVMEFVNNKIKIVVEKITNKI